MLPSDHVGESEAFVEAAVPVWDIQAAHLPKVMPVVKGRDMVNLGWINFKT